MSTKSNGSGPKMAAEKVIGKRSGSEISQESESREERNVSLWKEQSTTSIDNFWNQISTPAQRPQRIIIVRHAGRMDRLLPDWLEKSFEGDKYFPIDTNQPQKLPPRDRKSFNEDAPLTAIGTSISKILGQGLAMTYADIKTIFTSPSLRCVETANGIIKGYEQTKLKMNIEPGLFELLQWYSAVPDWMTPKELATYGYSVNADYTPVISTTNLVRKYKKENSTEHYERLNKVMEELLNKCNEGGTVLIVGHGTTIDAIPRKLLGLRDATKGEGGQLGDKYPFCSVVALKLQPSGNWELVDSRVPPISYFDFKNNCDLAFLKRM